MNINPNQRNPFGLSELDELGRLEDVSTETELYEAVSKRGNVAARAGAYVGNAVSDKRYRRGVMLLLVIFALCFGRAGWLQVVHGATYRALADANRTRTIVLPSARGVITDRNGVELAVNTPSFTLVGRKPRYEAKALATELPAKRAEREKLLTDVATVVDGDPLAFMLAYDAAAAGEHFALMVDVSYENALIFAAGDDAFRGIDLVLGSERSYITDSIPTLSHVLGYTGIINTAEYEELKGVGYQRYDRLGKQGVEQYYEQTLRGTFGKEIVEVNSMGRYLRTISKEDPVDGDPLVLTIDARLQEYIELVLEARLANQPVTKVAVVAMDPQNGDVLALTSWPAYDANLFAQGIDSATYQALLNDEDHPLFPRATAGEYPSGSTIKPVYAAAALTEEVVTPETSFLSVGGLQIGNRFFPDWRGGGHGVTNVYHAIADSVNTYFYYIGGGYETFQGLGIEKLMTWAATFGYGTASGLDVPGEGEGFLPSKEWKEAMKGEPWYIGDTYNVSIGQGDFLATPVQVARATAVFANGGNLVTPHLALGTPVSSTRVIEEDVAQIVKDAMRRTVTQGTATSMQSVGVEVAGKTGTAQWSNSAPPHSWFTGFAPYDAPSIVLTVIAEDGGDVSLAVPIAREILTWYFTQ